MTVLGFKNVSFVPIEQISKQEKDAVCVFKDPTDKRKKKKQFVGRILLHPKIKRFVFAPEENWSFCGETLTIIARFIFELENGLISYKEGNLLQNEDK